MKDGERVYIKLWSNYNTSFSIGCQMYFVRGVRKFAFYSL